MGAAIGDQAGERAGRVVRSILMVTDQHGIAARGQYSAVAVNVVASAGGVLRSVNTSGARYGCPVPPEDHDAGS